MKQPQSIGAGREQPSVQSICGDQREVISKRLAAFQAQPTRESGAFSDPVPPAMSGWDTSGNPGQADVERHVRELQNLLEKANDLTEFGNTLLSLLHEMSQPLTAMSIYAAGCRQLIRLGHHEELDGALQQIIDQGERAFQVAHTMRELLGAVVSLSAITQVGNTSSADEPPLT